MKMNIKNSLKITAFCASLLAFSACDVTDQSPVTLVPEEEAFSDAGKVQGNILGVYDAAQRGWYLGAIDRGYPFGAASIQQGDMRGGDMYNDQLFYEVTYINGWSPTTANNEGQWIGTYRLINRINVVLEGLQEALANGVIDQGAYDSYRAEMLFLRAFSHWDLVINFSRPYSDDPSSLGIPYRDFAVNNTDLVSEAEQIDRGTVAGVYARVLADLDEAEELGGDIGPFRASRGAAIAFKAKVKLHQDDWAGVLEEYGKLGYALAPSPEVPFRSPDGNTESIFSLNNTAESNPGVNGALPAMYGNPAEGGRGLVKISPVIWNAPFWLEGDARRTELTSSSDIGIFTSKYDDYINRGNPTPLIRYAEIVLIAAEAHARLGDEGQALELLNSVRDRAIPEGAASLTAGDLSDGILQAIWNEKRVELLAEGAYWYDIHRLSGRGDMDGIPAKAPSRSITSIDFYAPDADISLDHSLPYSSNLFIWPIPLQEVVNNPVLAGQQNPGY
ncbi:RagB/SusD family nutrient uptake outer membrane protein [Litoribacter alkaliphilus]|uniref:RagB/SusD family nutrient uptake outer membrane protein n=1 Tax=Litoribacter ruber TaxID=702568 RepID=A0AAP2CF99_9BACT|nr:RagB/SusD family nutrient uptake outer membrane protein [Litoribacter alkaliphilus]MBS9523473.1 RagB/SusD family nutrient uptake outer membrane protein [Litoribacter alkaliphilus]